MKRLSFYLTLLWEWTRNCILAVPAVTTADIAHARGLWVEVWTIDDPAEMRMLIEIGVDGIITDRPDLLMEVLGK